MEKTDAEVQTEFAVTAIKTELPDLFSDVVEAFITMSNAIKGVMEETTPEHFTPETQKLLLEGIIQRMLVTNKLTGLIDAAGGVDGITAALDEMKESDPG